MDMFVVHGGRPLAGSVRLSGAKNAALPIMAAALMAEGKTTLQGVPHLDDVDTLALVLAELGLTVARNEAGELELEVVDSQPCQASYDLVRRMRASFCVLGPLLARRGQASVSLPGGCNLGHRPIDLHLKGLRALGAEIEIRHGYVEARASRLRGAHIYLGGAFGSTVTGTCNVMMAAALAEGVTIIEGAACEPEVIDLGRFLCAMGARIEGLGTPRVTIEGVPHLKATSHHVIPDRIEAATLMIAAAIAGGEIVIEAVCTEHLTAVIEKLREIGVSIESRPGRNTSVRDGGLGIRGQGSGALSTTPTQAWACHTTGSRPREHVRVKSGSRLRATDVIALPYPGIPTDVQAQMTALLCLADGISVITDKVFPDRFMHVAELGRLGARIRREGPSAIVSGVERLSGAYVMASDLRASAALVLAGLAAEGATAIRRIYHLDRGYERLDLKLRALGTRVERVPDEAPAATPPRPAFLRGPAWLRPRPHRARSGPEQEP